MKNGFINAAFAMFVGLCTFTACDDDEHLQIEKDLNGTYKSELTCIVTEIATDGSEKETGNYLVPQRFTVAQSAGDVNCLDLIIQDVRFNDQNWGDLTLNHLKAGYYADCYTFNTETEQSVALNSLGNCVVTVTGSGNTKAVSAVIYVTTGNRCFELVLTGTKLIGNESSEGAISSFVFDANYDKANAVVTRQPEITGRDIRFHVAPGSDVTKLKATVTTTPEGMTKLYPKSNVAVDFTIPVTYIVAAEDGTRIEYTVTAVVDEE